MYSWSFMLGSFWKLLEWNFFKNKIDTLPDVHPNRIEALKVNNKHSKLSQLLLYTGIILAFNRIGTYFWRALPSWNFASRQTTLPVPLQHCHIPCIGWICRRHQFHTIIAPAGIWWMWGESLLSVCEVRDVTDVLNSLSQSFFAVFQVNLR